MNYILFLIFFALLVVIVFTVMKKYILLENNLEENDIKKNLKENFSNFVLDKSKVIYESSCKLTENNELNDNRVAWGFDDCKYFHDNKDAIFSHYDCDKELINYYDKKVNDLDNEFDNSIKEYQSNNLPKFDKEITLLMKNYRVGFGKDNKNNIKKIYLADTYNNIYSLKIGNNGQTESHYDTNNTFTKKEFIKFIGEKKGTNFFKELKNLVKSSSDNSVYDLEIMNQINTDYNADFKNEGVTFENKDFNFEDSMMRYKRTDNNKVVAYIFAFTDEDIKLKNCKEIIINIGKIFNLNTNKLDEWLDKNNDHKLTWISVNKKDGKHEITLYHTNKEY